MYGYFIWNNSKCSFLGCERSINEYNVLSYRLGSWSSDHSLKPCPGDRCVQVTGVTIQTAQGTASTLYQAMFGAARLAYGPITHAFLWCFQMQEFRHLIDIYIYIRDVPIPKFQQIPIPIPEIWDQPIPIPIPIPENLGQPIPIPIPIPG